MDSFNAEELAVLTAVKKPMSLYEVAVITKGLIKTPRMCGTVISATIDILAGKGYLVKSEGWVYPTRKGDRALIKAFSEIRTLVRYSKRTVVETSKG
jgi:hypothetical protein